MNPTVQADLGKTLGNQIIGGIDMDRKERYIIELHDGTRMNAVAKSFQEVLQMFGEENVCKIEKLDYEEVAE